MAEIHIEKKRGLSKVFWLILLVALAILGYMFFTGYFDARENATQQPAATTSSLATDTFSSGVRA